MPTLFQQLALSYESEGGTGVDALERSESQNVPLQPRENREQLQLSHRERDQLQQPDREQLQISQQRDPLKVQQQRERDPLSLLQVNREREKLQIPHPNREQLQFQQREQLHREKMQQQNREREQLHQLQSFNNLLLDLPSSSSYHSNYDNSCALSSKTSSMDDMSISDLFGLGLPRGSLMSGQSACNSSGFRHHQHYGQNHNQSSTGPYYQQSEDNRGYGGNSSIGQDVPSSPTSVTTPGSPSTPGSLYSNPHTFHPTISSSTYNSPSSPNRSQYQHLNSPISPINSSPYYGRPIRGSPSYSDCSSPSLDYPHMTGCNGSRSNSPADSETSGVSSMDGSLSDIMNCLSLNSSSHQCYPQSLSSMMSAEMDMCPGNRAAAYQRMAAKKYMPSPHQHHYHHHSHNHSRNHHTLPHSNSFLNSYLNSEKSCCPTTNPHLLMAMRSPQPPIPDFYSSLDRAARCHRNAAALCEATRIWRGVLPQRTQKPNGYSPKVFLGGVPWDITDSMLVAAFKQFGSIRIEWPGKEQPTQKGYVYVIFESEKQGSDGWSCGFKKRQGLKTLTLKGEISNDIDSAKEFAELLVEKIKRESLKLENIYNADESGIYWKILLKYTFALSKKKSVAGFKDGKDRFTALFCANASGFHRIPLLIIGKSAKPTDLENLIPETVKLHDINYLAELGVIYSAQESGWMNCEIFQKWYEHEFIPRVLEHRKKTGISGKVLLILDNASSHPSKEELNAIDENFEVMFLPPNVTAIIQPMDQSPISTTKKLYKRNLMKKLLMEKDYEKIVTFLKELNLRDCLVMLSKGWSSVDQTTFRNAWKALLPEYMVIQKYENPIYDEVSLSCETDALVDESNLIYEFCEHLAKCLSKEDEESEKISHKVKSKIEEWFNADEGDSGCEILTDEQIVQSVLNSKRKRDDLKSSSKVVDQTKIIHKKIIHKKQQCKIDLKSPSKVVDQTRIIHEKLQCKIDENEKTTANEAHEGFLKFKSWVMTHLQCSESQILHINECENMLKTATDNSENEHTEKIWIKCEPIEFEEEQN